MFIITWLKKQNLREIIVILSVTVAWNMVAYYGSRLIASSWHHYDITTEFDRSIPLMPWTIIIYFGCYLHWAANYLICAAHNSREKYRFFTAEMLAKGISMLIFLLIPTTAIRPQITGTGLWNDLMRLLYTIDSADNLLPSLHCVASWFCWIGIRKRKDIPAFYRYFSLVFALAVCVSTLTTKQHVILDVIVGVLLAEVCYLIAGIPKLRGAYESMIGKILNKVQKPSADKEA